MIERVVIRGKGWGKKDKLKNVRDSIALSPKKLTCHGKKLSSRTYQRAIKRLQNLGLLRQQGIGSDQVRIYSPAWWVVESLNEAQTIWRQASTRLDDSELERPQNPECQTDVTHMTHPCHAHDAPPVTIDSVTTPLSDNQIQAPKCDIITNGDGRRARPTYERLLKGGSINEE